MPGRPGAAVPRASGQGGDTAMELLTFAEVRRLLKVSRSTLYRLIKSGRLPVVYVAPRTPRIRMEDVEALLKPSAGGREEA